MKSTFLLLTLILSLATFGWSQGRNALAKEAYGIFGYSPGEYYHAYLDLIRKPDLRLPAGNSISVIGTVQRPGEVLYGDGITASKAIADVGGLAKFADGRHIGIWKADDGKFLIFDLNAVAEKQPGAKDPVLEGSDIVIVLQRRLKG